MEISLSQVDRDLFLIQKKYRTGGAGNDISGPFWMLMQIRIQGGEIFWMADKKRVYPKSKTAWLYVPPYSWTQEHSVGTCLNVKGLVSSSAVPKNAPSIAVLFSTDISFPKNLKEIENIFSKVSDFQEVSLCSHPTGAVEKIKMLIDKNIGADLPFSLIAKKLKSSDTVISRQFKKIYGYSPTYYRRGLKVTIGMFSLLMGLNPATAAANAGYNDLGRFYKQFGEYMKMTPGQHRLKRSKNAKTQK